MAQPPIETPTKIKHGVAVYLFLAVGVIVGTIGLIAYLFTGK